MHFEMIFYVTVCGLAVVLSHVPVICGDLSLQTHENKTMYTVECRASFDIRLMVIRETDIQKRKTIAECETSIKACYLTDQSLGRYYAVYYTGYGAMFSVVNDINETCGTYLCCETYNSSNCVNMKLATCSNATKRNTNENQHEPTSRTSETIHIGNQPQALMILNCVLMGAVLTVLVIIVLDRTKDRTKVCLLSSLASRSHSLVIEAGTPLLSHAAGGTKEVIEAGTPLLSHAAGGTKEDTNADTAQLMYGDTTDKDPVFEDRLMERNLLLHAGQTPDPHRHDLPSSQRDIEEIRRILMKMEAMLDVDIVNVHNTENPNIAKGVNQSSTLDFSRNPNSLKAPSTVDLTDTTESAQESSPLVKEENAKPNTAVLSADCTVDLAEFADDVN